MYKVKTLGYIIFQARSVRCAYEHDRMSRLKFDLFLFMFRSSLILEWYNGKVWLGCGCTSTWLPKADVDMCWLAQRCWLAKSEDTTQATVKRWIDLEREVREPRQISPVRGLCLSKNVTTSSSLEENSRPASMFSCVVTLLAQASLAICIPQ